MEKKKPVAKPQLASRNPEYQQMVNRVSHVTDFLAISGMHQLTIEKLLEMQITCIIEATNRPESARYRLSDLARYGIELFSLPVEDSQEELIHLYFEAVNARIRRHRLAHGRTLVHCQFGISRSATLVLAYLMDQESLSLRDAFLLLRSKRSFVRPNIGFWRQLIAYEGMVHPNREKPSVRLIRVGKQTLPDVQLLMRGASEDSFVMEKLSNTRSVRRNVSVNGIVRRFKFLLGRSDVHSSDALIV